MKKLKAIIVGAGNIGAFFDSPDKKICLTHAHAYTTHSGFELAGFVDNDLAKAKKAAAIWGGNAYGTLEEAWESEGNIDVVSVCVPDEFHFGTIKQVLKKPVRLIFAEKPLTQKIADAEEIIDLAKAKNVAIAVNYSRRFVPEFQAIASEIKSQKYGNFLTGHGYYGKGVMHNGSHLLDLIRLLVGEIKGTTVFAHENDFYETDPSVSAVLSLENGKNLALLHTPATNFTLFELDLVFEKGRIEIRDSGNKIEISKVLKSDTFEGYKYLVKDREITPSLNKAIYFAIDNIFNHLDRGEALLCSGEEGSKSLKSAIQIKESL